MSITKPPQTEYPTHYHTYISKVTQNDLIEALTYSGQSLIALIASLAEQKYDYRYAEGKWTIRELIAHIIDCERVFMYRALSFARNDKSPLPGFEENEWAAEANAANRSMDSLMEEYQHVRGSSILFFESITDEAALRKGTANGREISVRSLGYAISGHELHHIQVIKEKYLP